MLNLRNDCANQDSATLAVQPGDLAVARPVPLMRIHVLLGAQVSVSELRQSIIPVTGPEGICQNNKKLISRHDFVEEMDVCSALGDPGDI